MMLARGRQDRTGRGRHDRIATVFEGGLKDGNGDGDVDSCQATATAIKRKGDGGATLNTSSSTPVGCSGTGPFGRRWL